MPVREVTMHSTTASYTITAAETGAGTKPTVTSLTPSLSSPRGQGTELDFICIAADVDSDAILYRFFLTGPGTASKKKLVQDWSQKERLAVDSWGCGHWQQHHRGAGSRRQ